MIKLRILILTMCLLVPASTFAQKANANKSWQTFWTQFSTAITKKDGVTLKKLTAPADNFSTPNVDTPEDLIATIQKQNLWNKYRRSVASGTKVSTHCATQCRTTKNEHLLFEVVGGRWRWTGLMGD